MREKISKTFNQKQTIKTFSKKIFLKILIYKKIR